MQKFIPVLAVYIVEYEGLFVQKDEMRPHSGNDFRCGYVGLCYARLLLWYVCSTKNTG